MTWLSAMAGIGVLAVVLLCTMAICVPIVFVAYASRALARKGPVPRGLRAGAVLMCGPGEHSARARIIARHLLAHDVPVRIVTLTLADCAGEDWRDLEACFSMPVPEGSARIICAYLPAARDFRTRHARENWLCDGIAALDDWDGWNGSVVVKGEEVRFVCHERIV